MRFDSFYQFLVPLTFLAIWALTSLFNRDAQPLPPRAGRPPGPGPNGVRPTPASRAAGVARPRPGLTSAPAKRGPARRGEDLLIIGDDTKKSPAAPRAGKPEAGKAGKARLNSQSPAEAAFDARATHSMGTSLSQSMPDERQQPEALVRLTLPPSPLLANFSNEAPGTDESRARAAEPDAIAAIDVRKLTRSPARVRESFILSELLQPPLALRNAPGARR